MAEKSAGGAGLGEILELAEEQLWVDFKRAGAFKHRGIIGTGRELALVTFLNRRLPSRYEVASGEIVDIGGTRSGQIDVLVYDAHRSAPLVTEDDGRVLIGAEAVLAVIEVKSTLTRDELGNAIGGAKRVRALRPWGQEWARYRPRGTKADDGPRCFTSVLAFRTDIGATGWSAKELQRVREECAQKSLPPEHIDRIAVLSRGLLLPADGLVASNDIDRRVLGMWYSALLNFLARESDRRPAFPWTYYESWEGRRWEQVCPPEFSAPTPTVYSKAQIGKYKTGRAD